MEKNTHSPNVFDGLTENDLASVYNTGRIIKLKAGEKFIREGDTDRTLYVILDGSVRIEKIIGNTPAGIAILGKGSCVGEIAFTKNSRRTASAVTTEPSTVIALNDAGLNTLPPNVRSVIFKNLREIAARRIYELDSKVNELSSKNIYLTSYIKDVLKHRSDLYTNSEMIRNIVKSFPRLPMYATRLTELLVQENTSLNEVIEFAKTDPSLVSVVLKTANSPYYNFPAKVADFQHAVLLMGFNQIYQIIMDNGIGNIMPKTREFEELRFHSLLISVLSFEIALLCNSGKPLVMNTIGLLHGIGKSIIFLLKKEYPNLSLLLEMLDDGMVASMLLREWNLPDIICRSIEHHHYPEFSIPREIPVECREAAAILYLAHLCCEYMQGIAKTEFLGEYMEMLSIKTPFPELVNNIMLSLNKKFDTLPENVRNFIANVKIASPQKESADESAGRS